jgi:hypothetical protein
MPRLSSATATWHLSNSAAYTNDVDLSVVLVTPVRIGVFRQFAVIRRFTVIGSYTSESYYRSYIYMYIYIYTQPTHLASIASLVRFVIIDFSARNYNKTFCT